MIKRIPTEICMAALSGHFELIYQKDYSGKFCNNEHSFYFNVELMYRLNRITEGVFDNLVTMRSAWVPKGDRGNGIFMRNMEIILEYAKGAGCGIIGVANPFELAIGSTREENDNIFINDVGFRLVGDYEEEKIKQRSRMRALGFKTTVLKNIGDRDRIKKKDRMIFQPQTMSVEMARSIYGQR